MPIKLGYLTGTGLERGDKSVDQYHSAVLLPEIEHPVVLTEIHPVKRLSMQFVS